MKISAKVTIIMATYNRAHFIYESLKAIQVQTFTHWECIIIDDGGTDNTKEIIEPLLNQDSRFKFLVRPSRYLKGLPGCRNFGLDLAKGDYIIFFDDDDIAHPQNLELCVDELSRNSVSFCRYLRETFTGDFISNYNYEKEYSTFKIDFKKIDRILKNELLISSCSVLWKKECFKEHRFLEYLMYAEEWELYSRIILSGFEGISINKTLYYVRKHPNSNTGEFYNKDTVRMNSNADAILLVIINLNNKNRLTKSILRHFIQTSMEYEDYNLFNKILNTLDLSIFEKIKWKIFYYQLPLRLFFYKIYKQTI